MKRYFRRVYALALLGKSLNDRDRFILRYGTNSRWKEHIRALRKRRKHDVKQMPKRVAGEWKMSDFANDEFCLALTDALEKAHGMSHMEAAREVLRKYAQWTDNPWMLRTRKRIAERNLSEPNND